MLSLNSYTIRDGGDTLRERTFLKKRKHHYVWGHYLKPWAPNGSIFCLRGGLVFPSGITGVANRRDFYKLEPLSLKELVLLKRLAVDMTPEHLRATNEGWLETFAIPFALAELLKDPDVHTADATQAIQDAIHNFEEDLHTHIEGGAIQYLAALRQLDASFFDNPTDAIDFLHYLCLQYLRTARMQEAGLAALNLASQVRFDRIWKILRHVYATNIASVIYFDRANWRLHFLENASSRAFLTGDQPLINTRAVRQPLGDRLEDLEFYYPLSPDLALLLTRTPSIPQGYRSTLDLDQVDRYNRYIVDSSHEQVYAESAEVLEKVAGGLYR